MYRTLVMRDGTVVRVENDGDAWLDMLVHKGGVSQGGMMCSHPRYSTQEGFPAEGPEPCVGLVSTSVYPQASMEPTIGAYWYADMHLVGTVRSAAPIAGTWVSEYAFKIVQFTTDTGIRIKVPAGYVGGVPYMLCEYPGYPHPARIPFEQMLGWGPASVDSVIPDENWLYSIRFVPDGIQKEPAPGLCAVFWKDGSRFRTRPVVEWHYLEY